MIGDEAQNNGAQIGADYEEHAQGWNNPGGGEREQSERRKSEPRDDWDDWDNRQRQKGPHGPPRELSGKSWLDYLELDAEKLKEAILLGDGWILRGGCLLVAGPPGSGKSVVAAQTDICWAVGRPAFHIKPPRPLRQLLIQAEDDDLPLHWQSHIIEDLKLSPEERELVAKNTRIERVSDLFGDLFLDQLEYWLEATVNAGEPFDLVKINPFSAYLGASVLNEAKLIEFLRMGLSPLLHKYRCGLVLFAHPPKSIYRPDTSKWQVWEWMYSMKGGAEMADWARGVVIMDATDDPSIVRFIACKNQALSGWSDSFAYWKKSYDPKRPFFTEATPAEVQSVRKGQEVTAQNILSLLDTEEPVLKELLIQHAKKEFGCGEKKVMSFVKILLQADMIREVKMPKRGRGPKPIGYIKNTLI